MSNEDVRIVLKKADGGVKIVIPAPNALKTRTLDEIIAKANPENLPYELIRKSDLPEDRYFREAWKPGVNKVLIDKPKAKAVKMEKIRQVRNEELVKLDADDAKANNTVTLKELKAEDATREKDELRKILEKKQVLRDLPQTVDLTGKTIKELRDFVPAELEHVKDRVLK